jgi:hypothetical protein
MKKLILVIAIIGFAYAVNAQTTTNETKKENAKTEQTPSKDAGKQVSSEKSTSCGSMQKEGKNCTVVCKESKACTGVSKDGQTCTCVCKDGKKCTGTCQDGKTCTCVCKDGKKCTGVCGDKGKSHSDCQKK